MSTFNAYSRYYDLLYKDKDYKSESAYVVEKLKKYFNNPNSILELGCGSGSHANYLCKDGFSVFGIERSVQMVEEAKNKKINNFEILNSDICVFRIDKKFDCAISLFHVISYVTENSELIKCFQLTNQHLVKNGIFLFDVWFTPAVHALKPERRVKKMEDEDTAVVRTAESKMNFMKNTVAVNFFVEVRDKASDKKVELNEVHSMRHFSIPEIEMLATQTGFEILEVEEFLSAKAPGDDTWAVSFILKKIADA